jgi:hypothetical protein
MKTVHDRLLYLQDYVKRSKLKSTNNKGAIDETFNLNYNGIDGLDNSDRRRSRIETSRVSKYGKNYSNK